MSRTRQFTACASTAGVSTASSLSDASDQRTVFERGWSHGPVRGAVDADEVDDCPGPLPRLALPRSPHRNVRLGARPVHVAVPQSASFGGQHGAAPLASAGVVDSGRAFVAITDRYHFEPRDLKVTTATQVTFSVSPTCDTAHEVSIPSCGLQSPILQPGESWTTTLPHPGVHSVTSPSFTFMNACIAVYPHPSRRAPVHPLRPSMSGGPGVRGNSSGGGGGGIRSPLAATGPTPPPRAASPRSQRRGIDPDPHGSQSPGPARGWQTTHARGAKPVGGKVLSSSHSTSVVFVPRDPSTPVGAWELASVHSFHSFDDDSRTVDSDDFCVSRGTSDLARMLRMDGRSTTSDVDSVLGDCDRALMEQARAAAALEATVHAESEALRRDMERLQADVLDDAAIAAALQRLRAQGRPRATPPAAQGTCGPPRIKDGAIKSALGGVGGTLSSGVPTTCHDVQDSPSQGGALHPPHPPHPRPSSCSPPGAVGLPDERAASPSLSPGSSSQTPSPLHSGVRPASGAKLRAGPPPSPLDEVLAMDVAVGPLPADDVFDRPPTPDPVEVTIDGYLYVPAVVRVPVGGLVRWVVASSCSEYHSVRGRGDSFQSPVLCGGDAYTHRFDTPGKYQFSDAIYCFMRGTVVVEGSAPWPAPRPPARAAAPMFAITPASHAPAASCRPASGVAGAGAGVGAGARASSDAAAATPPVAPCVPRPRRAAAPDRRCPVRNPDEFVALLFSRSPSPPRRRSTSPHAQLDAGSGRTAACDDDDAAETAGPAAGSSTCGQQQAAAVVPAATAEVPPANAPDVGADKASSPPSVSTVPPSDAPKSSRRARRRRKRRSRRHSAVTKGDESGGPPPAATSHARVDAGVGVVATPARAQSPPPPPAVATPALHARVHPLTPKRVSVTVLPVTPPSSMRVAAWADICDSSGDDDGDGHASDTPVKPLSVQALRMLRNPAPKPLAALPTTLVSDSSDEEDDGAEDEWLSSARRRGKVTSAVRVAAAVSPLRATRAVASKQPPLPPPVAERPLPAQVPPTPASEPTRDAQALVGDAAPTSPVPRPPSPTAGTLSSKRRRNRARRSRRKKRSRRVLRDAAAAAAAHSEGSGDGDAGPAPVAERPGSPQPSHTGVERRGCSDTVQVAVSAEAPVPTPAPAPAPAPAPVSAAARDAPADARNDMGSECVAVCGGRACGQEGDSDDDDEGDAVVFGAFASPCYADSADSEAVALPSRHCDASDDAAAVAPCTPPAPRMRRSSSVASHSSYLPHTPVVAVDDATGEAMGKDIMRLVTTPAPSKPRRHAHSAPPLGPQRRLARSAFGFDVRAATQTMSERWHQALSGANSAGAGDGPTVHIISVGLP